MKAIVQFSARFLEPVMRFANKASARESLTAMQAIPAAKGGVLLAATNGHVAIIARDPGGWMTGTRTITFVPEQRLVEQSKSHPNDRFMLSDSGLAHIVDYKKASIAKSNPLEASLTVGHARAIQCNPPNIIGVFPDGAIVNIARTPPVFIDPGYVGLFSSCFSAMAGVDEYRNGDGVELCCEPHIPGQSGQKIIVMPLSRQVEAMGIIMSIRANPVPYTKEWMQVKPKPRIRVVQGQRLTA